MKISTLYRIPIHAIFKRLGFSNIRKRIWDNEFDEGRWLSGPNPKKPYICDVIAKYLPKDGTLLDLGCSDGIIACTQEGLGKYIGVDISEVAIELANKNDLNFACEWVCSDISKYEPSSYIDVVLFRQSIYYLRKGEIEESLIRYRKKLNENGVFIVVMNNPKRHQWITDLISKKYNVIEYENPGSLILVFK